MDKTTEIPTKSTAQGFSESKKRRILILPSYNSDEESWKAIEFYEENKGAH